MECTTKSFFSCGTRTSIFFPVQSKMMIPAIFIITLCPNLDHHLYMSLFNLTAKPVCELSHFCAFTCTLSSDCLKIPFICHCVALSQSLSLHLYPMLCIQSRLNFKVDFQGFQMSRSVWPE